MTKQMTIIVIGSLRVKSNKATWLPQSNLGLKNQQVIILKETRTEKQHWQYKLVTNLTQIRPNKISKAKIRREQDVDSCTNLLITIT